MEEPDNSYSGFGWDERFFCWQYIFYLKRNGWQVGKGHLLLW